MKRLRIHIDPPFTLTDLSTAFAIAIVVFAGATFCASFLAS